MKKNILLAYLALLLLLVDVRLRANENSIDGDKIVYAIQFITFSKNKKDSALEFLDTLDEHIQSQTALYLNGELISLRYKPSISRELLLNDLEKIKDIGFEDAYIVESYLRKFQIKQEKLPPKNVYQDSISYSPFSQEKSPKKLTKYEYKQILNIANKFKESSNLHASIEKYETLFDDSKDNEIVNNNLFYLYGKTNNWNNAKLNLQNINRKDKLLYAYGLGSLESYSKNLEKELQSEIDEDFSGYVNLILGVLKERENNFNDAYTYYETAYIKNRSDIYIAFAYARAYELIKKYDLAQKIYFEISAIESDRYIEIKALSLKRYLELKELLELNIEG